MDRELAGTPFRPLRLHRIYRLRLERDGDRVRLITEAATTGRTDTRGSSRPRAGGAPVTNIRNTSSPHWRMWIKPESRCLVPANSFAEYAWTTPGLWLLDHRSERRGEADPSEGDAGNPNDCRGA
jgi:hypothetical protein